MNQSHLELKVGTFVAMALVILVAGILFFGNQSLFSEGYKVKVHFRFTNSVMEGAPVRYSGVNVGKVKNIEILNDQGVIELTLLIDQGVVLRENIEVYINTLGVMGEKYIELIGGSTDFAIVTEGSVPLQGKEPIAMNNIIEMARDITSELSGVIKSLNAVLGEPKMQEDFKTTIAQVRMVTQDLSQLTKTVNEMIGKNKPNIEQTITNVCDASQGINKNMAILEELFVKIKKGEGVIGQLLTDKDLYKDMEMLMADIREHPWKLLIKTREKKVKKTKVSKRDTLSKTSVQKSIVSARRG